MRPYLPALLVAFSASLASAQTRPIVATVGPPIACASVPFTTPVVASIVPHDLGGGTVAADVFVLAGGVPAVSAAHNGSDVTVRLDAPAGSDVCRGTVRLSGLPRGSYTLHLIQTHAAPPPWGPAWQRPGEAARAAMIVR